MEGYNSWKSKRKYAAFLLIMVFIIIAFFLIVLQTGSNRYSYDNISRKYLIGKITSISEKDKRIELLLDNRESASVTMTVNGKANIHERTYEKVKIVDFTKLKTGQAIQCDIRLSVTLEKINFFHDCRQIFIFPDEEMEWGSVKKPCGRKDNSGWLWKHGVLLRPLGCCVFAMHPPRY